MALKSQQSFISILHGGAYKEVEEVTNIAGPDGKAKLIDVTHLRSVGKEYLQGLADFGQISLDCNFSSDNEVQMLLRDLYAAQTVKQKYRLHIPDDVTPFNHVFEFQGIVSSWNLAIKTDDKTGLKITLQVSGGVDYFPPAASPA